MDTTLSLPSLKIQKLLKGQDEGEDIISELPDNILHHILSFLPTKDAIRTSILSTRWQYLWTSISNFDFDDKDLNFEQQTCLLNLIDSVLIHEAGHIKKLHLALSMPVGAIRLYRWAYFAVNHNVQELDLSLPFQSFFRLPRSLFTSKSLGVLKVEMDCVLKIPSSIHFSGLQILHLSLVFSGEHSTEQFFSGFPVLQELVLCNCGWKNIKTLTISIPTLRKLTIFYDVLYQSDLLDCEFKIYAVNLVSLSCTTYLIIDLSFCNLSSLVDAFIDAIKLRNRPEVARGALKLLAGVHAVKSLTLSNDTLNSVFCAENLLDLAHIPTFYNLIHLEMNGEVFDYSIVPMMDFLQKSPCLESLDIPEGLDPDTCLIRGEGEWIVPHCLKSSLKTFSISEFYGNVNEIHLLNYLSKNAAVLERMMVFCSESLIADLKKQEEIRNRLLILREGLSSCVIEFL